MKIQTPSDRVRPDSRTSWRTRAEIAGSLGVSATTVDSWLRPADNAAHRNPGFRAIGEGIVWMKPIAA